MFLLDGNTTDVPVAAIIIILAALAFALIVTMGVLWFGGFWRR